MIRQVQASAKPKVTKTYTMTGSPEAVARVERLLAMIWLNGMWGHSGLFGITWDGDGADHLDIQGIDANDHKDAVNKPSGFSNSVEYVGEGGRMYIGYVKNDEGHHYLGHKQVWPEDEPTGDKQ